MTGNTYKDFIQPANSVGRQDGLFISTAEDIDQIIRGSNGDISVIETQLDIPSGAWQDRGGIYRVDIVNPELFEMRMATGNEIGANEFWTPGGVLPTGKVEAVTSPIPKSNIIITKVID